MPDWQTSRPRVSLGHWPTPLEPLERLSQELGGPEIWLKRDDCSGLAFGGNKTRKLEFLLADAQAQGAQAIITFGAVQSNHARQTAAACAKLGLPCHLILSRRVDWPSADYESNGNVLLDALCGAHLHIVESAEANATADKLSHDLANQGLPPYVIPPGGSNAVGAFGYSVAVQELVDQCQTLGFAPEHIVHASASAGTQAGLLAGCAALSPNTSVMGVNVFHPDPRVLASHVRNLCNVLHASNDVLPAVPDAAIDVNHAYFGSAYGQPTKAALHAIRMAAELEGVLFDPVYSGKALAGLIDQINLGNFAHLQRVIFIHTGGGPSLGVYADAFDNVKTS